MYYCKKMTLYFQRRQHNTKEIKHKQSTMPFPFYGDLNSEDIHDLERYIEDFRRLYRLPPHTTDMLKRFVYSKVQELLDGPYHNNASQAIEWVMQRHRNDWGVRHAFVSEMLDSHETLQEYKHHVDKYVEW